MEADSRRYSGGKSEERYYQETARELYHEPYAVQGAKALAVWLFNIGARGLVDTQAAFNRNPAWRSA